ncbi:MAG: ABC transporter permease [Patescibacteria group bacterium]|nr:ABC transporter permease [Patescibacteria group bacterium]
MGFVKRGIKNTFRSPIRTLAIVLILGLSIGLAVTMLIARASVQKKIDSVKGSIGNMITVSPAGARGFEGGGEPLTMNDINKVKGLNHISSVSNTLMGRATTSDTTLQSPIEMGTLGQRQFRFNGGETERPDQNQNQNSNQGMPIFTVGTDNPTTLSAFGGGTVTIKSGSLIDGNSDTNTADIGQDLATKNNLNVGSTFKIYNTDITVSGIFDAGNKMSNSVIVFPIKTLQRLSSQPNEVSSTIIQVDSINNLTKSNPIFKMP